MCVKKYTARYINKTDQTKTKQIKHDENENENKTKHTMMTDER